MAWYAYCIVEQQAVQGGIRARRPVPVEGLKGIADAQIFAYPSGDFSVLVSEYIPTGDLGQKALLQHAHVVSECFKRTTVLPFRFGTVFDTDDALRRAVRFGDGFTVPGATRDVYDRYVSELKKENRPTDNLRFASGFWFLVVSNDPEKTFAEAAEHVIYQVNNYSVWLEAGGLQPLAPHLNDREALRQSGLLQVVDPETAIRMIRDLADTVPITHFYSWTLPPGLPPRWAGTHLELFASKVIPAFR